MKELSEIKKEMRLLDGDTLRLLKKAAKKNNVSPESLIWLLTDVFNSGKIKSHAFHDCPECVKNDGLIQARRSELLNYTPWELTEKGKKILSKD